ncbi:hypothetical protein [Amycolatopsis anabasis]|uniref:hypothetical protein n=1 Tax=Amycolatopsis anabasis TaxID=1840409 RepID=UPI00131E4EC1|nr:hypothetical protein [Amycolatopsis anabasis]
MSWNDFYRRRDVMDAVLRQAARNPGGELPFADVPGAAQAFACEEDLLLALHYRWTQLLSGYLRAEVAGPEDAEGVPGDNEDHVDAVTRACHAAAADHDTLRAVLDANLDRYASLRSMREAEQRMLAITAGLAEPHEPVEEITKVGAAFDALLRNGPARPARRRSPVGSLLRMLAPSA